MEKYVFTPEKRAALESLRQPLAIYQFLNRRVVTLLLSDGFCELFGYTSREAALYDMDHDMYKDTHPDDAARIADAAVHFATAGGRYEVVYRTRKPNSSEYTVVHAMGEHVFTEDGTRLAHVWYTDEGSYTTDSRYTGSEITQALSNALHEQSIVRASRYDYLTGLPSMTYFFELADSEKTRILTCGELPVLLYLDFCGMKFYNTKHGFAAGDQMLQSFARLLAEAFGNENCCRIAGDHFAAISSEREVEEKLRRIFREFAGMLDGRTPPVHVGIYPSRLERVPTSTACDRAKLACSTLKGTYNSAFSYYSAELRDDVLMKQSIIENLDTAIREKWIKLYIQPIIRAVNGKVCEAEALSRWVDPERGVLAPASFVPVLEEAGLIYKLDLYMLEQVLEALKTLKAEGYAVVPHSINLSRADFDACDMVEEIRTRVDAAGIEHDRITIEITESVIGSDFEFMKEQVERFHALGFPVWMDDFGSGYSSLDVLQSMRFDVLKFDMSFMKRLDDGAAGKVILTELMRMANALGVDTVCEGVETEAQVRFLQEIGCSKLQGYYYSKPTAFETVIDRMKSRELIPHENVAESAYYQSIGRVNLFDLGVIAAEEEGSLQNTFSTIPIAVLEVRDGKAAYVRSNRSYRRFIRRFFKTDIHHLSLSIGESELGYGLTFQSAVKQCCEGQTRMFFDEKMPDGSRVHSLVRRVSVNPVTGAAAIAIAVLSISEPDESTTYAEIARALAADYYNIYVIDLDTDEYIEYSSRVGGEELSVERRGADFFESAKRDTLVRIYEEDREPFLKWFSKENVIHELDTQGVFTTTYRLIDTGAPMYVNMKITRMQDGNRIILGVSIIDAQMKQQEEEKKLRQERISLGRIASLAPAYIVLYTVNLETGHYTQFNASKAFTEIGLAQQGEDFFTDTVRDARKAIDPRDLERHLRVFTKNNVVREIQKHGIYIHNYRLMINGESIAVTLRATLTPEEDGEKLLLGVAKDDREEYRRRMEEAYEQARDTSTIFTHVALSLARGYTDLFYVNLESDDFIEYHTDDECGVLTAARRGPDFFDSCERDAKQFVHPDDRDAFMRAMNRDFLREALSRSTVYELAYRRIKNGATFYVRMRVSRVEDDRRFAVIAVSDIDEEMRQRFAEKRMKEERVIYARLHAITGNFLVVYVIDPETGSYREFSANDSYEESFAQAKQGTDFFKTLREAVGTYCHPDDRQRVLSLLTQENVMTEVEQSGLFTLGYRIMAEGRPMHVQLKAAIVEEEEGPRLIVGLNDIDVQVRQEEEFRRRLARAEAEVNIDALTGVKNRHAYHTLESHMNHRIALHRQAPFAVVIFDVNDLKIINDTSGHSSGDQYLRDACKTICDVFKHSPVFRVGGDEFAVVCQGADYAHIDSLLADVEEHNRKAALGDGIMIACGMAKYEGDESVAAVYDRADISMYQNKNSLKTVKKEGQDAD